MTVKITSEVLGLAVGASYTGSREAWLLNEGYATSAATVQDAWLPDGDGVLGGAKPAVTITPTPAVLAATVNAVNQTVTGKVIFGSKGGVRTEVSLTSGDTPAQAATKIDTALGAIGDAAIVSSKLNVTSTATGPSAFISVVGGDAAVLTALKLAVGDAAHGGDGRPAGASNTGVQAGTPAADLTSAENREAPYWPSSDDLQANIANDGDHLTVVKNPAPGFDVDPGGVDDDAPSAVTLDVVSGPEEGGTVVTLSAPNDNLQGVTAVSFGGVAGTALDVSNAENGEIKVTTGAHAPGAVNVVLTDASGNLTLTNAFTYLATP